MCIHVLFGTTAYQYELIYIYFFLCSVKHFENLEIMESKLPPPKGLFQMGILLSMISRFSKCTC